MATLYVEQKSFLESVVRRIGVPARDVDDVVHDVFVKLAAALDRFDPDRGGRAWLATIARRTARDYLALGRTRERPFGLDVEAGLIDGTTPEARLLDAELRANVRHAVGQGDEVLAHVVFHEQTWAEIASDLGVPVATVQSRLRRAYAVLEARLRRRQPLRRR